MYQPLIWVLSLRDDAGRLGTALDSKGCDGLANSLIDGVGRDPELGGNLFRAEMLIDQTQAIELAGTQPRYPLGHCVLIIGSLESAGGLRHAGRLLQC
jgi:hypothetical protein